MRHEDWPERLAGKLREWNDKPFVWGETDCVMFIVEVAQAISDQQITVRKQGQYTTERGALKQIKSFGADLAELVTLRFGEPIARNFAQRGDLLMHGNNLGICIGPAGVFRTPEGLVYIDLSDCSRAWKVD